MTVCGRSTGRMSAIVQAAGFVAWTIAPCRPSPTAWVGVTEMSVEADRLEPGSVLREGQRAGDAADEAAALGPLGGGQGIVRDDVADPDPAAGLQHAGDLGEDRGLVGREVDDAVADDDVDRGVAERDRLDPALAELDVGRAGLGRVATRQLEHLVGHVQAVGEPGRSDARRGQQDVDAAAGPEVQDDLAGPQLGDGGRVAAAQAGEDGRIRQRGAVGRAVEQLAPGRFGRPGGLQQSFDGLAVGSRRRSSTARATSRVSARTRP